MNGSKPTFIERIKKKRVPVTAREDRVRRSFTLEQTVSTQKPTRRIQNWSFDVPGSLNFPDSIRYTDIRYLSSYLPSKPAESQPKIWLIRSRS